MCRAREGSENAGVAIGGRACGSRETIVVFQPTPSCALYCKILYMCTCTVL